MKRLTYLWVVIAAAVIMPQTSLAAVTFTPAVIAMQDLDGDRVPDAWEIDLFHTDPSQRDTDFDGFDDGNEIANGFNPSGKGTLPVTDRDGDGLTDRQELLFGTDPFFQDTDGDGRFDGHEVLQGHSPTSTDETPMRKEIRIVLKGQHLYQVLGGIPFTEFLVSTGRPGMRTPTGKFKVLSKNKRAWSRSAGLWMPWWMAFTWAGNGIHELPEWPGGTKEGASHLGRPVSHGCVRLGVGPAKQLFDWAPVGTPVVITAN
jgi:L,D-transpeptidase-like protein/thrombospondin type 3 repeat protein